MKRKLMKIIKVDKSRADKDFADVEVSEEFTHKENTIIRKDSENILQKMKNNFYRNL